MSNVTRNRLAAGAVLALGALFLLSQWNLARQEKLSAATTFSHKSLGTSIFFDLITRLGGSARTLSSPLLEELPYTGKETLALLSPSGFISKREAKLFANFVKRGGTLVLSAHQEVHRAALTELLAAFAFKTKLELIGNFENGHTREVKATHDRFPFAAGESYAFYGLFHLGACPTESIDCYFQEIPHGKGRVLLFASVPPFSNVLLQNGDNRKIAARLARGHSDWTFDEYHHYFSDRTFWDLMRRPAFGLTMVGIGLMLFLFFFFAHTPLHEKHLIPPERRRPVNFHQFNEHFVRAAVGRPGHSRDTLLQYYHFLARAFPEEAGAIEAEKQAHMSQANLEALSTAGLTKEANRVLHFHYQLLLRKGRLTP